MKTKNTIRQRCLSAAKPMALCTLMMGAIMGCSEDFLKPEPMSFFEPEATFANKAGLDAAMAQCDRHIRYLYTNMAGNTSSPMGTEYAFSEMLVFSKTDNTNMFCNIEADLSPTNAGDLSNIFSQHWEQGYIGIKYANSVLSYIDKVEGLDETLRMRYKAQALFHRAWRYYYLVFQFGDVPLITKMPTVAKFSYRSTKKEAILDMLVADMETAVRGAPTQAELGYAGKVSKGACRMLLAKLYMAVGKFTEAKAQLDTLIDHSGYALLQGESFGTFYPGGEPNTWKITRNIIWDMHRPENKILASNKEAVLVGPNMGTTSSMQTLHMRIFVPHYAENCNAPSPATVQGINHIARNAINKCEPTNKTAAYNNKMDYARAFGRGIGCFRLTSYSTNGVWNIGGQFDNQDLRRSSTKGNWMLYDSLKYNNIVPNCQTGYNEWYGKYWKMKDPANDAMLLQDSLRDYSHGWPHYKYYLLDNISEANQTTNDFQGVRSQSGGNASFYILRLAEAYLLRAECKYYLGEDGTSDVNAIRNRAKCSQTYTTVSIGDIMDERARELYMEEWRHAELNRVGRCLALSGKTDEWSNTYNIGTYDRDDSYWYRRIDAYNNFYNKGTVTARNKVWNYKIGKHNIYYPIPNATITANNKAAIAQNYGYTGYDASTPKWDTWQEAAADEDKQ